MTKEEAKREISNYLENVLNNIASYGLSVGISDASENISEECIKIAEGSVGFQTIDDCVRRARDIASKYGYSVKQIHDMKTFDEYMEIGDGALYIANYPTGLFLQVSQ